MSDGCSVPLALRFVLPQETPAQCHVCALHDQAYYYGGSRADRRAADAKLREGLIGAGMPAAKAWGYWLVVRFAGTPWYRMEGISWAFGDRYFKYSREPARPADRA